jgi:hypothetical protein
LAKSTGLAWSALTVADSGGTSRDIRNDFTEVSFSTPRGIQDVTGIDKSAHERLLLLADFTFSPKGVFNPSANMSHAVFSTVPSTSVNRLVVITVNGTNLQGNLLFSDYALSRSATGELTFTTKGDLADGAVPTWS